MESYIPIMGSTIELLAIVGVISFIYFAYSKIRSRKHAKLIKQ